jgi:alcohol dehydrogenase class IV
MVKPFQFSRIPKIIFSPGGVSSLAGLTGNFGKNVVLVAGRKAFLSHEKAQILLNDLVSRGVICKIVETRGEPSPEIIDNNVQDLMNFRADLIVAIGGGSAIDAGKALSAMMHREESVVEYLEGIGNKEHPGTKVPFIAVPTTSGTGSEATKNAVLSRTGNNGFKRSLRHDNFVPEIALVDPLLTLSCPPDITAASGMDCFTQLTESYLSVKASQYTDALSLEGIRTIEDSLLRCYIDGNDIQARTGMSMAALTSGICLANAGLGVVHGFASSLGGLYDIPHGIICGTLMVSANEVNVSRLRSTGSNPAALEKYASLGKIFLEEENKSNDYYIDGFLHFLNELTVKLKLPGLKQLGVKESDIASVCSATGIKENPVKLGKDDLEEILLRRLT